MKNLKHVSLGTWVRTALIVLALINQGLVLAGKQVLPISDKDLEAFITATVTAVTTLVAWWKNNNFTSASQDAQVYLDGLKSARKGFKKAVKAQAQMKAIQQMAETAPVKPSKAVADEDDIQPMG